VSVTVLHPAPVEPVERFRLHRAGLIGLYEYEDETFEFERGRLLLRGPNGSGKSKALELLLPLLLDGELRAERLDPFGGRGRSMRWNLIGDQESRAPATGFSWLELHRRDEHGIEHFHTLVLMARANKGETGVRSWFALLAARQTPDGELHGSRIGISAFLTQAHHPISKAALTELAGELIESASVYRERVNALLFGVAQDRYDAIVRLLLSLRKPQLSQTLDPQELSTRLTEALPELDRDAVLRVSGRLDQLDRLRAEAAELREVRTAVATFARTYRDWARAALRERGRGLVESVRARDQHAESLARAMDAVRTASGRREALAQRRQELESSLASARGAERELRASEDWRAAERLEELRRLAEGARATAAAAAAELERAKVEQVELRGAAQRADAALSEQQAVVGSLLTLCAADADRAGVAAHEAAVEGLIEEERDLAAVGSLLEQLAATRAQAIAALAQLARALDLADQEHRAARSRFEDAEARQRERQAERAAAAERLELVRGELLDALERWLGDVQQLPVDDGFADELAARIARAGEPSAAAARELAADRAGATEQRLREQLAEVTAGRAALAAEREPLAAEHARLSAHEDPVPAPLPFRTADRTDRLGAPLWALVDFADGLDDQRRAGLEGALEGSGLLDAWVMPDGAVLDADDAVLVPAAPGAASRAGAGPTLANALVPVADGPVAAGVVEGVLTRVVLADAGAGSSSGLVACASPGSSAGAGTVAGPGPVVNPGVAPVSGPASGAGPVAGAGLVESPGPAGDRATVGFDGSFALGPLRGRRRVDAARYIGVAARAANRARRLAELSRALAVIEERDRALETRAAELESAIARLHDELRGLPDDTPAVRAYVQLDRARAEEQRAAAVTAAEQETMSARAAKLTEARERAIAHSREHRLPPPTDADGLVAVHEALASYRAHGGELIGAERLRREQRRTAGAALEHGDRATRALTAAEARGRVCREEASARVGAHEAAAAAVGASVDQLRARLASLEADAAAAEQGLREAHEHDIAAASQAAAAERDTEHAAASLVDAEHDVASKHARVASVGRLGAWSLALGDDAPDDHASAGDWPLERTLAAVRAVSREALATRRGFETLLADVDREADELRHRLSASADFEVSRERVSDDPELTLVQVRHGGQSHPIGELDRWLEGELQARDRTIAEEDRRLFESFLVGGLADALRERVASAGTLVAGMNAALTECTTSSGMSIELEWRPREHDQDGLREAVSLLRRDVALLTDDARARLVEFLRGRIENARHSLEQGSSTEHVMAALDYREWHEFRVIQRKDGHREVLTRRRHQQGSGGEKAVALHLPLFAAAAAQFAAAEPTCPRMILLDEAFAGIDERMRAQLVGLLERFDLDFVLTSHELWGCYPELSALGIYHLHREPGIPGVATAHFRWDGRRRVEVTEAA
jgi:Putative exonuclease SbcCD, C subunit